MEITTRPETVKVTQVSCVELGRNDIEIALTRYVESHGHKVDSLFHFKYLNGVLHKVSVDIKNSP